MVNISKLLFTNPAQIIISAIKCNYSNIIKITNVLDCKLFVLTIDSIRENSAFFKLIEELGLKYSLKKQSINYIEISTVVPYNLFNIVLNKAINENPENIFMFNLINQTNWNNQLEYSFEKLVSTGITDIFLSFSFDENAILLYINKSLLSPREIYKKIKSLKLE